MLLRKKIYGLSFLLEQVGANFHKFSTGILFYFFFWGGKVTGCSMGCGNKLSLVTSFSKTRVDFQLFLASLSQSLEVA